MNSDSLVKPWMRLALSLAETAKGRGEVPVGAVIVRDDQVLATGFNLREHSHDPCAHAELIAIRRASAALRNWRLVDCELFVTLEPCLMCAGAIYQSRLKKVHFATRDPKAGALVSLFEISKDKRLNHQFAIAEGELGAEAQTMLKAFFAKRRAENKAT